MAPEHLGALGQRGSALLEDRVSFVTCATQPSDELARLSSIRRVGWYELARLSSIHLVSSYPTR
jgi:hypothetical protein